MTADEQRRAALRRFLAEKLAGNRAALQQRLGLTKGRMTQLLEAPDQPYGERAARSHERKLRLPAGYFDRTEAQAANEQAFAATPELAEVVNLWPLLPEQQRLRMLVEIRQAVEIAKQTYAEMHRLGYDRFVGENESGRQRGRHHIPPAEPAEIHATMPPQHAHKKASTAKRRPKDP